MLRRNSPLIWAGLVYVVKSLASDQENRLQVPEPAPKKKIIGRWRNWVDSSDSKSDSSNRVWVQVPPYRLHFCYVRYIVV